MFPLALLGIILVVAAASDAGAATSGPKVSQSPLWLPGALFWSFASAPGVRAVVITVPNCHDCERMVMRAESFVAVHGDKFPLAVFDYADVIANNPELPNDQASFPVVAFLEDGVVYRKWEGYIDPATLSMYLHHPSKAVEEQAKEDAAKAGAVAV